MPHQCDKELVIDRLEREVEALTKFKDNLSSILFKLNGYIFTTMILVIGYLLQQQFFYK